LPQLVNGQRSADVFFKLGGGERRTLRREQLLITLRPDERAVFLERGDLEDALRDFFVADFQTETIRIC
jgi:hypothetical protein